MNRIARILLAAWMASGGVQGDQISELEEIYGPTDLAMVSGMGGLTVGVNGRGSISLCKWPSPGYDDQVSYRTRSTDENGPVVEAGDGLFWGIRIEEELVWLNDSRWRVRQRYRSWTDTIMVTESRWPDSEIVVTQRVAVLPAGDVFVCALEMTGFESAPQVFWYANFAPCTRRLPELPVADWMLDGLNDFAAFADLDEQLVVHFRPAHPGKKDWARAAGLIASSAGSGEWEAFGEGTWIGYRGGKGLRAAYCGAGNVTPSEAAGRLVGLNDRVSAVAGQCHSVVELILRGDDDGYRASVTAAFGKTFGEMRERLDAVANAEAGRLIREAARPQPGFLRRAPDPPVGNPEISKYLSRARLTLLASRDSVSGSVVRSPAVQPPLARDWPRNGAWIIYALDLAGAHELSEKHLNFYLDRVRTEYVRGKPMGSLPASTYSDGTESSPHLVVDDEAVCWMLWALNEHGRLMPERRRSAYLSSHWDKVVLCADFIALWKDNRRGAPLWSKDPIRLRDPITQERLFAAKLGLDSAIAIAAAIERPPDPLWVERLEQVDNLVRGLLLDGRITWEIGRSLPMFLSQFGELDEQDLDEAVQLRLDALERLSGYDAAKAFTDAVMAWRGTPEKLEGLRPYALMALQNALTRASSEVESLEWAPGFPDALTAALCIVAVQTLFESTD